MVINCAMITLHDVHKFYGKQDVLTGVDLHIGPGMRFGLVGPNGAGKSTLLGLILGRVEPDQGSVFKAKGLRLGYLPQDLLKFGGKTVLELAMDTGDSLGEVEAELAEVHQELAAGPDQETTAELLERQGRLQSIFENLGGYDLEARALRVLSGLGFRQDQLHRDVGELSGGWLMRAALARILLSAPDLILLDEPTNHLDLESLLWLETQLVHMQASLVLVSHDPRVFGQGRQPHRRVGPGHALQLRRRLHPIPGAARGPAQGQDGRIPGPAGPHQGDGALYRAQPQPQIQRAPGPEPDQGPGKKWSG